MTVVFPFRQTLIATAVHTAMISITRPPQTEQEARTRMAEHPTTPEQEETPTPPENSPWLDHDWDSEETPAAPMFDRDPKREQEMLVKVIGTRMRQARELCNLSQCAAARRLGYATSSKLSKVEGATDTNSVPLWLILRAAKVYDVSVDFLFGATDDWEVGAPRGAPLWMLDCWEKARQRDLLALEHVHRKVAAVSQHIGELARGVAGVADALATLRERAPAFDELPASGTVAGRLERLQGAARAADRDLQRFRFGLQPGAESRDAEP